jgi:Tfp pilus assembly protein PilV
MLSRQERRRRAQAGTTLIELLVSMMIIGLVVVLLVGTFSTGLIDATLVKRNTAVTAADEYELEKIGASLFNASANPYSECFAVDNKATPTQVAMGAGCPAGTALRADVSPTGVDTGVQRWAVQIRSYPSLGAIGPAVAVYKVDR